MAADQTLQRMPVPVPGVLRGSSAVVFLALAGVVYAVMQSFVAPALPVIAGDLGASIADVGWVLTAYLLAASVGTPIVGRLGDMFGKRRMLLVVLAMFCVGTVVSAVAGNSRC